jgi:predicted metal-binding protein
VAGSGRQATISGCLMSRPGAAPLDEPKRAAMSYVKGGRRSVGRASSDRQAAVMDRRMQPIEPPVSNALVLVCEKCGKRLDTESDKNPSRRLVSRLKKMAKKSFDRGEIRAVATSCMDLCPEGEVSVAIVSVRHARPDTRFFTVGVDDIDATATRILDALR